MTREEFWALAARGPVILDGATGSNLRKAGMPLRAGILTVEEMAEEVCKLVCQSK